MAIAVANLREVAGATMSQADRDVLIRLIEYAMSEADRAGEMLCAHHLSKALAVLRHGDSEELEAVVNEMSKRSLS
ncbi:MAG: hypothetical protein AAGB11_05405 [Pseudomonadota bacterium]